MKFYENRQFPGQQFPFYLRRSSYIHASLLLFTLIGGKVVVDQQKKLRDANLELVQASVRVDMVAMPKYTLNELKNLSSGVEEAKKEEPTPALPQEPEKIIEAEKPVEKKEIADDPTAFQEANKQKRQSFLSKLKEIGSKKLESAGNQKAEKGLYGEKATDLKQLVLAGNKLSKGTAIYGDGNAADMTAFQAYASRLPDLVRPHWRLPSFLLNKNLKARVRVWLAASGDVTRAEIYQSSGDTEYDQRAVDAVRATSPFPRLSDEFAKRGQTGGILLGFPL
ncbi:MAG: TonB family protein [Bacteriovorax sp.]|jgi:TonB family protein